MAAGSISVLDVHALNNEIFLVIKRIRSLWTQRAFKVLLTDLKSFKNDEKCFLFHIKSHSLRSDF